MAKARDIAALAGLAGLAFANREKLFGSKDKSSGMVEEKPRRQITDYMKKAPVDEKSSVQSDVLKTITTPKAAPIAAEPAAPATKPEAAPVAKPVAKPVSAPVAAPVAKPVVSGQKKNIVSKKQLEDYKNKFGQDKTLTDYMNSQRASANKPIKPVSLPASYRHGGAIKGMASGGMTASRRGDGIATKGKTRGKIC